MKVRSLIAVLAAVLTAGVVSAQTGQVPAGETALGRSESRGPSWPMARR